MLTLVLVILISLLLSAFFSGSEMAFVTANKLGVEVLKNKGHKKGKLIAGFYENPKAFLGAMLVGNNIALVIFTISMAKLIQPPIEKIAGDFPFVVLLTVTIISTIVVLMFGEFLPKTFFRLFPNELLYKLAYPIRFFKWLLAIPAYFMTGLSNFILKYIFRLPTEDVANVLTRVDLEHYIEDSLSEEEDIDKEILTNALNLGSLKVRDCMIPRKEIVYVDKTATYEEVLDTFIQSKMSRVLVVDGDIENVDGYIHHQQLLGESKNIKKLILPLAYVPEAMNAQELMHKFIKDGTNIACVVDEFGGTAGLITLEDILEEIFGEIEDEHDQEDYIDEMISDSEYLFSGRLEIDYLNEKYEHLKLPEGDFQTLSGYIVMTHGSIPETGAVIELDNYKFILEHVADTRIETVRVIILHDESA
ncbi:MAG TPA: hemolysin family protein [Saprospiraceae bacterium]|nr:HlyC/CorC family transporter [Saprospiraceae bacterium]MCB9328045.1 HlyC/CorC family transporter [Lewinellaceae bacterium]HPK08853.1 hemolysin family protein [Saprospiraceae bacterium]HPQ21493.1 hemolysin family protein [Saprospiraceae bacterium]HRX28614.1 hemolysin family protein [Saprospiraceae bacterium]